MKINHLSPAAVFNKQTKEPVKSTKNVDSQPPKQDRIELSNEGRKYQLQSMLKTGVAAQASEGADPAKLEALKAALAKGTYSVPSKEIAKSILE